MIFSDFLNEFTHFAESNKGREFATLFSESGIYDDYIYGRFQGRCQISDMLSGHFHRDAEELQWEMYDSILNQDIGYSRYRFSFLSKLTESEGKRVVISGISIFKFKNGLVSYYGESVNGGLAMIQLGLPAKKIKRVFENWFDRSLKHDGKLRKMLDQN